MSGRWGCREAGTGLRGDRSNKADRSTEGKQRVSAFVRLVCEETRGSQQRRVERYDEERKMRRKGRANKLMGEEDATERRRPRAK